MSDAQTVTLVLSAGVCSIAARYSCWPVVILTAGMMGAMVCHLIRKCRGE